MKTLKVKKDFSIGGKFYIVGDEVKTNDITVIKKLNAKGFIEPLTHKEMVILEREITNNKIKNNEEE